VTARDGVPVEEAWAAGYAMKRFRAIGEARSPRTADDATLEVLWTVREAQPLDSVQCLNRRQDSGRLPDNKRVIQ
jgi:hypothetical protein